LIDKTISGIFGDLEPLTGQSIAKHRRFPAGEIIDASNQKQATNLYACNKLADRIASILPQASIFSDLRAKLLRTTLVVRLYCKIASPSIANSLFSIFRKLLDLTHRSLNIQTRVVIAGNE